MVHVRFLEFHDCTEQHASPGDSCLTASWSWLHEPRAQSTAFGSTEAVGGHILLQCQEIRSPRNSTSGSHHGCGRYRVIHLGVAHTKLWRLTSLHIFISLPISWTVASINVCQCLMGKRPSWDSHLHFPFGIEDWNNINERLNITPRTDHPKHHHSVTALSRKFLPEA